MARESEGLPQGDCRLKWYASRRDEGAFSGVAVVVQEEDDRLEAVADDRREFLPGRRVADRPGMPSPGMERAGMHWTIPGAQAMLDARSIHVSGLWEEYQQYRNTEEIERLYPHRTLVEQPLAMAA